VLVSGCEVNDGIELYLKSGGVCAQSLNEVSRSK
jgi:hypothetical protein